MYLNLVLDKSFHIGYNKIMCNCVSCVAAERGKRTLRRGKWPLKAKHAKYVGLRQHQEAKRVRQHFRQVDIKNWV